jgi:hypothetical protein
MSSGRLNSFTAENGGKALRINEKQLAANQRGEPY